VSADFARLLAHLANNLVAHADRDRLTGPARAVFLARGGHNPGTVCPSQARTEQQYRCAVEACSCGVN
jgi:hypothetical protein